MKNKVITAVAPPVQEKISNGKPRLIAEDANCSDTRTHFRRGGIEKHYKPEPKGICTNKKAQMYEGVTRG